MPYISLVLYLKGYFRWFLFRTDEQVHNRYNKVPIKAKIIVIEEIFSTEWVVSNNFPTQ